MFIKSYIIYIYYIIFIDAKSWLLPYNLDSIIIDLASEYIYHPQFLILCCDSLLKLTDARGINNILISHDLPQLISDALSLHIQWKSKEIIKALLSLLNNLLAHTSSMGRIHVNICIDYGIHLLLIKLYELFPMNKVTPINIVMTSTTNSAGTTGTTPDDKTSPHPKNTSDVCGSDGPSPTEKKLKVENSKDNEKEKEKDEQRTSVSNGNRLVSRGGEENSDILLYVSLCLSPLIQGVAEDQLPDVLPYITNVIQYFLNTQKDNKDIMCEVAKMVLLLTSKSEPAKIALRDSYLFHNLLGLCSQYLDCERYIYLFMEFWQNISTVISILNIIIIYI